MFLHPWAIGIGMAAAAIPVIVHFLTKPRPVSIPFSTLRFVREAVRDRRARYRLRDIIVLVARSLAVALLAVAVSRPLWGERPLVSDAQAGDAVRVVIVDVSQSMAAVHRGMEGIERARSLAAAHLRYRPGLRANLILAGARPKAVFPEPSQNFESLRTELTPVVATAERLDASRALALAGEMLMPRGADDSRRRELVIISDFQRGNWARADFGPVPPSTQIQFESTAGDLAPQNIALLGAQVRGRAVQGKPVQLEMEVGNFSSTLRQVAVEVRLGESLYRLAGPCPPGRRTTLAETIELQGAGWQVGEAKLVGIEDVLRADDARGLAVEVRGKPRYALVTRQRPDQRPSSSHFIECALVPDARQGENRSAELVRIDPGDIDREQLSTADLIVLDHPGKISADGISLLASFLSRGRAVLYVTAEITDATNLRQLTESAGAALQLPVEFAPPRQGQARRDQFLASVRKDELPFNVFGDSTEALLGRLRFAGGLATRRLEGTLDDDILATYSDGAAGLVVSSSEQGVLAVLNADLNRSNLPTTSAFVPLLDALVDRLLERSVGTNSGTCGEPLAVRLPPGIALGPELRIEGPEAKPSAPKLSTKNTDDHGQFVDDGAGLAWRWETPGLPGVYRVVDENRTQFALPIGLPAEESQLESLPADVLENRLATGRAVYFRPMGESQEPKDASWTYFMAACLLAMLGELAALIGFRS